jgi:hypothetical protein
MTPLTLTNPEPKVRTSRERHTIAGWCEIDKYVSPNQVVRICKQLGIYRDGSMTRLQYQTIIDAYVQHLFASEGLI